MLQTSEMEAFLNVSVALRPEDVSSGAICHAGDESGSDVLAGVDTDMVSGVDFLMSRRTRLKDGEYWSTMLPIPVPDFTSIYKAFSLGGRFSSQHTHPHLNCVNVWSYGQDLR